jgi:hypothetical protein
MRAAKDKVLVLARFYCSFLLFPITKYGLAGKKLPSDPPTKPEREMLLVGNPAIMYRMVP